MYVCMYIYTVHILYIVGVHPAALPILTRILVLALTSVPEGAKQRKGKGVQVS